MKILKLLNKTFLSILIIFSFFIVNSFSEDEPVDIWNIDKEQIQENSENKKMDFMLEHDLFSMEANSDVIISQINAYEMKLYDIETEISIQQRQIDVLKSKFSEQELNLTSSLMDNINIQLSSLRSEVGRIESQIALNSGIYGDKHGSVIALNEKHRLIKEEINNNDKKN